ncbi:hypothetical protein CBL_05865 [Carabus blaptoides fortunei]
MASAEQTYKHHTTTPNPHHTKSLVQAVKMVSFELMRISAATCRTVLHKAHHHKQEISISNVALTMRFGERYLVCFKIKVNAEWNIFVLISCNIINDLNVSLLILILNIYALIITVEIVFVNCTGIGSGCANAYETGRCTLARVHTSMKRQRLP